MTKMPFGKHKGSDIEDVPDSYFRWLLDQDWFEDQYPDLMEKVEEELAWRDHWGEHVR